MDESLLLPLMLFCLNFIPYVASNPLPTFSKRQEDYLILRRKILESENKMRVGSDILLDEKETALNDILLTLKREEYRKGIRDNDAAFLNYFINNKDEIRKSKIYHILKEMPKGSLLHVHDFGTVGVDFIISNLTYRDDLYVCQRNGTILFRFSTRSNECDWKSVDEVRKIQGNEAFDLLVKGNLSFTASTMYSNRWKSFESFFNAVISLAGFSGVIGTYIREGLEEIFRDNIKYVELRTVLPQLYDETGSLLPKEYLIECYLSEVNRFKETHADFEGLKLILTSRRQSDIEEIAADIQFANAMHEKYPHFVIGYDLVGYEDVGYPLKHYLPLLIENNSTNYFFHAGETSWLGVHSDENLIDAILLNTKRLGHGLALIQHPKILEIAKAKNIAVEVNPISNQMLYFMPDLRKHPLIPLFMSGYPIIISSDDYAMWDSTPLTDDFYMTFMIMEGAYGDLKMLKQLVNNSIRFSYMEKNQMQIFFSRWQNDWNNFVEKFYN